jgi:ABC-type multidrug transport system fused ATPase/permease subunit
VKNILLILTRPEKKRLLLLTLADILINILDIIFLAALLVIINYYSQQNYTSAHFSFIFGLGGKNSYLLIIAFFLLFSLKNLSGFFVMRKQNHFVYRVALRISGNTLSDYLSSDYQNYALTDSSVHIRKISQQAIQFGQYVLLNFQQIISQSVLITITVIAILLLNAKLFLLLVVIVIPPVILTGWLMKKKLEGLRFHAKINSEKSIQYLAEALNGYVESNVYDKREFFTKRFEHYQKKLNYHIADQQAIQGFPSRLIEIFAILGLCVLIVLTQQFADSGKPVLLIGAFMGAAYKIIPGIVKILNSSGQIKAYHFTITDLLHHNYAPLSIDKTLSSKIHSIAFENVSFRYNDKNILNNINFKIDVGDFVGISGISGKGKTTIINLLLGFLQPASGSIKINNDITEKVKRLSYLKNISYSKQQPFFIHDTLLKNVLFDDEDYENERLNEIIAVTGVDKIISANDKGLHYEIQENGKNISGGERQRIVFARTLYKSADLVILDEPFRELDEPSEIRMLEHLQQLAKKGNLIILISHNRNSLSYCNKIISLDD